jgi:hypothetical protein
MTVTFVAYITAWRSPAQKYRSFGLTVTSSSTVENYELQKLEICKIHFEDPAPW